MENQIIQQLEDIVGSEHVSTAVSERTLHAEDQSSHERVMPDVIVWPQSTEQVSQITKLAHQHQIAITGWGAGSSLEGNSVPLQGGIVVDFGRMNQIIEVHWHGRNCNLLHFLHI